MSKVVIDISKITLDNIDDYLKPKKPASKDKKEYQHHYYLTVTKQKRKIKKAGLVEKVGD